MILLLLLELPSFKNLQMLDLTGNQITQISPQIAQHVPALKELHMNGNLLRELPDVVCSLTSLEKLSMVK